jgi:hypothetical protein
MTIPTTNADSRAWRALLVAVALWTAPQAARAQEAVTVAEGLFREGLELKAKGELDSACAKLAESQRLDPSSGTLLNLADCHEKQGRTATAWAEFLAASRLAKHRGRPAQAEEARNRAAALEPNLSFLRIVLAESVPGIAVELDSVKLEASVIGSRIPVDPGERKIAISAPGYLAIRRQIAVGTARDTQTLTIPKLERAAPASSGPAPGVRDAPSGPSSEATREQETDAKPPFLAYAAGGAGLLAVGVGTVFAVSARSAYDDAKTECPSRVGCSGRAMELRELAERRATIATVGFGVGLAGLGAATYLLLTSGTADQPTRPRSRLDLLPALSPGAVGLASTVRFR